MVYGSTCRAQYLGLGFGTDPTPSKGLAFSAWVLNGPLTRKAQTTMNITDDPKGRGSNKKAPMTVMILLYRKPMSLHLTVLHPCYRSVKARIKKENKGRGGELVDLFQQERAPELHGLRSMCLRHTGQIGLKEFSFWDAGPHSYWFLGVFYARACKKRVV